MKINNDVLDILDCLNSENIDYFIIRDFKTVDDIINSKDIDIYINKNDLKRVDKLFKDRKWIIPALDNNKYPHKQYFKMSKDKIYVFDIVDSFYYGKNNLKLNIDKLKNNKVRRKIEDINVADEKLALTTMLMHIVFDKEMVSDKNFKILSDMYEDYISSKENNDVNETERISKDIIERGMDLSNERITTYQKELLRSDLLIHQGLKNTFLKIRNVFKNIIKKLERRLTKKTIAIIGMDGTGKSTIVKSLKGIYGEKCKLIYMGLKDFKITKLSKLVESKNNSFFAKVEKRFLLFFEMYRRYMEYRYSGKVLIFDRYVDDIFICSPKNAKKIDTFLFKFLFPKPKIKIYMYCKEEISFERKEDIEDKQLFRNIKEKFDNSYINDSRTFCISTDDSSKEETLNKVVEVINNNFKVGIF